MHLTAHQLETLSESLYLAQEFVDDLCASFDIDVEALDKASLRQDELVLRGRLIESLRLVRLLQSDADIPELKKDVSVETVGPGPVDLGELLTPVLSDPTTSEETKQQIRDLIKHLKHTI